MTKICTSVQASGTLAKVIWKFDGVNWPEKTCSAAGMESYESLKILLELSRILSKIVFCRNSHRNLIFSRRYWVVPLRRNLKMFSFLNLICASKLRRSVSVALRGYSNSADPSRTTKSCTSRRPDACTVIGVILVF